MAIKFLRDVLDATNDPATGEQIEEQLKYLYVEDHISIIQEGVNAYKKKFGFLPVGPRELVSAHLLNIVPTEPFGANTSSTRTAT